MNEKEDTNPYESPNSSVEIGASSTVAPYFFHWRLRLFTPPPGTTT